MGYLWCCFIALELLCDCSGIAIGLCEGVTLLWYCCGIPVVLLCQQCGIVVVLLWDCCGIAVGVLWSCCGIAELLL